MKKLWASKTLNFKIMFVVALFCFVGALATIITQQPMNFWTWAGMALLMIPSGVIIYLFLFTSENS